MPVNAPVMSTTDWDHAGEIDLIEQVAPRHIESEKRREDSFASR
jgi:hypothetical protein